MEEQKVAEELSVQRGRRRARPLLQGRDERVAQHLAVLHRREALRARDAAEGLMAQRWKILDFGAGLRRDTGATASAQAAQAALWGM